MASKLKKDTTEPVRIDSDVVALVRDKKKETGIPVGKFFEKAAREKLDREYVKSKK